MKTSHYINKQTTGVAVYVFLIGLLLFLNNRLIAAESNALIPFQGLLSDSAGRPLPDGLRLTRFQIFDAPVGGEAVWAGELHRLSVKSGLVNTLLGTHQSLAEVDFERTLYLGITIDSDEDGTITPSDPPLLPRQLVIPAPFAIKSKSAVEADSAKTSHTADKATTVSGPTLHVDEGSGRVGVRTQTPSVELEVAGSIKADTFVGDGSQLSGIQTDFPFNVALALKDFVDKCNIGYLNPSTFYVNPGAVSLYSRSDTSVSFQIFENPNRVNFDLKNAKNNSNPGQITPNSWFEIAAIASSATDDNLQIVAFIPDGTPHLNDYSFSRTVGWVHTDSNGQIEPFTQFGNGREKTYIWGVEKTVVIGEQINVDNWRQVPASASVPPGSNIIHIHYETGNSRFRVKPHNSEFPQMLWASRNDNVGSNSGWVRVGDQRSIDIAPADKPDNLHYVTFNAFRHSL
jgi:hypothetical protein